MSEKKAKPKTRLERLEELQKTVKDYAQKEKDRIDAEVKVLEAVLQGRTSGAGIQSKAWQKTSQAAAADLTQYLSEA